MSGLRNLWLRKLHILNGLCLKFLIRNGLLPYARRPVLFFRDAGVYPYFYCNERGRENGQISLGVEDGASGLFCDVCVGFFRELRCVGA